MCSSTTCRGHSVVRRNQRDGLSQAENVAIVVDVEVILGEKDPTKDREREAASIIGYSRLDPGGVDDGVQALGIITPLVADKLVVGNVHLIPAFELNDQLIHQWFAG